MKSRLIALLGTLAIALVPFPASALSAGAVLSGTLNQGFDSGSTQAGAAFTMSNVSSPDGSIRNATIYGHVLDVVKAGQGRPGKIELSYDKLQLSSGRTYRISGRTTNLTVNTKNNALKEGVGAVVGDIVGNYIGKHVGGVASSLGGVAGAAGGYLYAKNNRANVTVPANSSVTLEITRSLPQSRM